MPHTLFFLVTVFFHAKAYNQDALCDPRWVYSPAHVNANNEGEVDVHGVKRGSDSQFTGVKRGSIASDQCCPPGKYFNESTKAVLLRCSNCSEGKFSGPTPGAFNCRALPCPAGTFLVKSARACESCPKGRFNAPSKAAECKKCSRGLYNAEVGQSSCKTCEYGKFNPNAGSVTEEACKNCEVGKTTLFEGSWNTSSCRKIDSLLKSQEEQGGAMPAGLSNKILSFALVLLVAIYGVGILS